MNHDIYNVTVTATGSDLDVQGGRKPYELLLAALGSCTVLTIQMYANRKEWKVGKISLALTHRKQDRQDIIERTLTLEGDLDAEQRKRLLDIADKCPVHKTLMEEPRPLISTALA